MKYFIYILMLFFGFSCKKEETKHTVIYKVVVTKGNPVYSLSYSSANNTTKAEGSITTSKWTSPPIDDKKKGTVFLTLNGGNGGSYKMYIYVDGNLQMEDSMDDPYGPHTIEATIRD